MPWFTIVLACFARLPFLIAFTIWTIISITSLLLGFWLTARSSGLPESWNYLGMLACLAFPTYVFYTLLNGQPSAFGFLILALTYFLHKRGANFLAGTILSFLSFKPTLIVFIGPMLLLTRQWKILLGLAAGCATLGVISLWWAGIQGMRGYFQLLKMYSQAINSPVEIFQTYKYVDIGAAMRLLAGSHTAFRSWLLLLSVPVVSFFWYRLGPQPLSWALAIICGILLNLYSPIYDCTLLIFAVLLIGVDTLKTWLIAALYLVPLITVSMAKLLGIQLYTFVLIIFLIELMLRAVVFLRTAEVRTANAT
jgi:hypothetical protein